MQIIDNLLNRVTMYRLVLYYLIGLIGAAVLLSFAHVLTYDPYALLFSTAFILAVCAGTNSISARLFDLPANVESSIITALILALIITPISGYGDLWFLFWASVLSMASKYILNIRGKHLFNPAALGVTVTYLVINQSAAWWIGTPALLPFVLLGGLLLARKLRRFQMVGSFMAAALAVTLIGALFGGGSLGGAFNTLFLYSPFFFFAFVMLTEPLTSPPTNDLRNLYGAFVGVLFAPAFHIGPFYTTPEIALVLGNFISYLASPKERLVLQLKEKRQIGSNAWDFIFASDRQLAFTPGQYMEWTLGHAEPDSRGNRRYFTLASAPSERNLRLGVRFNDPSSSYKQAMLSMRRGDEIIAGQLAGDFTLPRVRSQPLVFIAGGIGITPYRSMIKYLLDTHRRRPITLFYGAPTVNDFAYQDVWEQAERKLGIRTIRIVEKTDGMPRGWSGLVGRIEPGIIRDYAPNYKKSIFYISGPNLMVDAVKAMLRKMGIPDSQIKTDFFSGY
jgi:ferredoxin-NADP reductase/Na+-translocating ferredoxin:NAD+ oxidoreductase RnfD subunit